jgi:hypothetical protein
VSIINSPKKFGTVEVFLLDSHSILNYQGTQIGLKDIARERPCDGRRVSYRMGMDESEEHRFQDIEDPEVLNLRNGVALEDATQWRGGEYEIRNHGC